MIAAAALVCFAAVLAGPVRAGLVSAQWPARAPRAAILLWQAVALSAGLAVVGAGIVTTTSSGDGALGLGLPAGPLLPSGRARVTLGPLRMLPYAGLVISVGVALLLVTGVVRSGARMRRARVHHRHLLDLVGHPAKGLRGTSILDHPAPVAYCVPGLRPRIVLSGGALRLLGPDQLAAVLAHEQAHLRWHHDLVILPFGSITCLRGASEACGAVSVLVEMAADDRARRRHGADAVTSALVCLAGGATPAGHRAVAPGEVDARLRRLMEPPRYGRATALASVVVAGVLLLVPSAVLAAAAVGR